MASKYVGLTASDFRSRKKEVEVPVIIRDLPPMGAQVKLTYVTEWCKREVGVFTFIEDYPVGLLAEKNLNGNICKEFFQKKDFNVGILEYSMM